MKLFSKSEEIKHIQHLEKIGNSELFNMYITAYHTTGIDNASSIFRDGLTPGKNKPAGQQWLGKYSGKGIYLHSLLPEHELSSGNDGDGPNIITLKIEMNVKPNQVVPDEETGREESDGIQAHKDGEAIVYLGTIARQFIKVVYVPVTYGDDTEEMLDKMEIPTNVEIVRYDVEHGKILSEQKVMTHGASWIDPDGKEHGIDEFDDHFDVAVDIVDKTEEDIGDDPILQLLKGGWVRRRGNSFEVYKNPTQNQKDIIFMLAKEHGYSQIWVDGTFGGVGTIPKTIIHNQPPEDLYESRQNTEKAFFEKGSWIDPDGKVYNQSESSMTHASLAAKILGIKNATYQQKENSSKKLFHDGWIAQRNCGFRAMKLDRNTKDNIFIRAKECSREKISVDIGLPTDWYASGDVKPKSIIDEEPPEALYESNKQPLKEQTTLESGCWIDPNGKIHIINSDIDPTHAAWAQRSELRGLVKDLDGSRALMDLLKKDWIAQRGNYFTVGYPLNSNKKDIIFMRAKELGYEKIGVDAYYDSIRGNDLVKQYLYQQPPEALYEQTDHRWKKVHARAGFIDPSGKFYPVEEHGDFAKEYCKKHNIKWESDFDGFFEAGPIHKLMAMDWIRVVATDMFSVDGLTSKKKDFIFMFAKENGVIKITLDDISGGEYKGMLDNEPLERLYESKKLSDLILNEQLASSTPPYRGVKHEKPVGRLEKAKSALPFMDRVKIKIDKDGRGDDAHHWPRSNEIVVSDGLISKYWVLSFNMDEWKQKYPQRYWNSIFTSSNRYGLGEDKIEFGYEYLLNTLAHELGHCVYDWLIEKEESGKQVRSKLGKIKLMTPTVGAYSRYVVQQQEEREESGGFISRALTDKVSHERFAEMFRLYVTQKKYSSFFDKMLKGI
jgi:hypothetical protein